MARIAAIVAAVVVLLVVAAHFLLPVIAERQIRGELDDQGTVEKVEVEAFPALKLIARKADSVTVELADYRAPSGDIADDLARADGVEELDVSARKVTTQALVLRDATLRKDGDFLRGQASVTDADVDAALPAGLDIEPVSSDDGGVVFEGTASVLGLTARIQVRVSAENGRIVLRPEGIPFASLATFTVFEDDRVKVERIGLTDTPEGFTVTVSGRLVG